MNEKPSFVEQELANKELISAWFFWVNLAYFTQRRLTDLLMSKDKDSDEKSRDDDVGAK